MAKFRTKPIYVDATKWFKDGDHSAVQKFALQTPVISENPFTLGEPQEYCYYVNTPYGPVRVNPGDWIVTTAKGETFAMNPDSFNKTYEMI